MKKVLRLKSTMKFDLKTAKRMVNVRYYSSQAKNQKMFDFLEKEKARLSTLRGERVSELLKHYTKEATTSASPMAKALQGIYLKNKTRIKNGLPPTKSTQLTSLLGTPEMLMMGYKSIKGNKGALTTAEAISDSKFNSLTPEQKLVYLKSWGCPDKISLWHFISVAKLIRKGLYVWGTSKRIYFDKPGQIGKKRPITIPPFMDKVVQKCIELILHSIYEPSFEKLNRSFGFRPNKGTQDALATIVKTGLTNGMRTAIEGDVEAAYDTVEKDKLIAILGKRIEDRSFLNMIRQRLNYDYVDQETLERVTPEKGIPQGGVDSPYLFNIYMHELDEHIRDELKQYVDSLNEKLPPRSVNKNFTSIKAGKNKTFRLITKVKKSLASLPKDRKDPKVAFKRTRMFSLINSQRLLEHRKNRVSNSHPHKKILRVHYVRYADDWIILTNGNRQLAHVLKKRISYFLFEHLSLKLSEEKTLITDITKEPARFLGFELKGSGRGALRKLPAQGPSRRRSILAKKSGLLVWAQPDRKRLINRLHMKGFCDANGFPLSIPWISCFEPQVIVERFNAQILGLANFYLPIIRNPHTMGRWIYILRFSCLKTLAQKYRTSIKQIFKRFGTRMNLKSLQTISIPVVIKFQDKSYIKHWQLLNYQDVKDMNG